MLQPKAKKFIASVAELVTAEPSLHKRSADFEEKLSKIRPFALQKIEEQIHFIAHWKEKQSCTFDKQANKEDCIWITNLTA